MTQFSVEVSDDVSVVLDVPPGVPALDKVDLNWTAQTEDDLRRLVSVLGFDAARMNPRERLHVRYGLPMLCDGEGVGRAQVNLWIGERLRERQGPPPAPALERLVDEARAEAEARA